MKQLRYGELNVSVADSSEELSAAAAEYFASAVRAELEAKEEIAVILATGNSQLGFIRAARERDIEVRVLADGDDLQELARAPDADAPTNGEQPDAALALETEIRQHLDVKLRATATRVERLATWARVILPPDIHLQAPPNLSDDFGSLIDAQVDTVFVPGAFKASLLSSRELEPVGHDREAPGHHVEPAYPKALDDSDYIATFLVRWTAGVAWNIKYWEGKTGKTIQAGDVEPSTWALAELGRSHGAGDYLRAVEDHQRVTRALVDLVIERLSDGAIPDIPVPVLLHLGTTRQPVSEPLYRRGGNRRYELTIHLK